MRSRLIIPLLTVAALVAAVPPGTPTPHGVDPADCRDLEPLTGADGEPVERGVCTVPTYLSCEGGLPAENPKVFILPNVQPGIPTPTPSLVLQAPTESVQDGAGCGYVEPDNAIFGGTTQNTPYELTVRGLIEGNMDSMTIELHAINVDASRLGEELKSDLRLSIDGLPGFGTETIINVLGDPFESPRLVPITFVPEPSSTQISTRLLITVTNLSALGFADNAGYGAGPEREVLFTISHPRRPDNVDVPDVRSQRVPMGQTTWVWGTTEVPSGIAFNPATVPAANAAHVIIDASQYAEAG